MSGIATKKQAALFATIFWLTYTIARYISGFINLKVSTKLKRFTELGVISALISGILSYLNLHLAATFLCAIVQGISVSGIYPLSLAVTV